MKTQNNNLRYSILLCGVPLLCMMTMTAQLHAAISIENLDDITINGWDGVSSNVTGFDDYCLISYTGTAANPTARTYDVAMQGASDNSGNFVLEHSGSNATMPVTFTWSHNNGNSWTMTDYSKTGMLTGIVPGATDCNDPNANVRVKVVIPNSSLQTATAGVYNSTYQVDGLQTGGGQYSGFQSFQVTLPELVQISGLDDVLLSGDFNQNIVAIENFCIFRNRSGDVAITSTSLHGGSSNRFRLSDTNGNIINYKVAFRQQAGFRNVRPGRAKTGFTGSSTKDCGGASNTDVRITVTSANTAGKPGGSYSDTLTIMIEPD